MKFVQFNGNLLSNWQSINTVDSWKALKIYGYFSKVFFFIGWHRKNLHLKLAQHCDLYLQKTVSYPFIKINKQFPFFLLILMTFYLFIIFQLSVHTPCSLHTIDIFPIRCSFLAFEDCIALRNIFLSFV